MRSETCACGHRHLPVDQSDGQIEYGPCDKCACSRVRAGSGQLPPDYDGCHKAEVDAFYNRKAPSDDRSSPPRRAHLADPSDVFLDDLDGRTITLEQYRRLQQQREENHEPH